MKRPTGSERRGRPALQTIIVLTLIVGSIVGLSIGFAWQNRELAIREAHRQLEEWNGASLVLLQVWASFSQFSSVHDEYIRTNEPRLADLASSALGILEHTLRELPDRLASAIAPLNITSYVVREVQDAYRAVTDTTDRDPALLRSASPARSYLENLTHTLRTVGDLLSTLQVDGTNPLDQIGEDNVELVADMMGEIHGRSTSIAG